MSIKKLFSIFRLSLFATVVALCALGAHTGTPDPDVPIGAIVAWHKTLAGVPQNLPAGWVTCDGQTITDNRSPLNGQATPNLSGGGSFLRGNTTSGDTGGANTHSHAYSGTTQVADSSIEVQANIGSPISVATDGHQHGFSGSTEAADNSPPYMTVVWIMRVK